MCIISILKLKCQVSSHSAKTTIKKNEMRPIMVCFVHFEWGPILEV